jgi:hypothetical protein
MTAKEPEPLLNIKFGSNEAFIEESPILTDGGNAIEHEHGRQRQLGVAGPEKLTMPTQQEIISRITALSDVSFC